MKDKIKEWLKDCKYAVTGDFTSSKALPDIINDCLTDITPQWISVNNRLPKHNVCVDVYARIIGGHSNGDESRFENVFYNAEEKHWWKWNENEKLILSFLDATHWMPLPEPPK